MGVARHLGWFGKGSFKGSAPDRSRLQLSMAFHLAPWHRILGPQAEGSLGEGMTMVKYEASQCSFFFSPNGLPESKSPWL